MRHVYGNFVCTRSIAGSSATIYAYLGEFHSSKNRSKVLMGASFIYGIGKDYVTFCNTIYIRFL